MKKTDKLIVKETGRKITENPQKLTGKITRKSVRDQSQPGLQTSSQSRRSLEWAVLRHRLVNLILHAVILILNLQTMIFLW